MRTLASILVAVLVSGFVPAGPSAHAQTPQTCYGFTPTITGSGTIVGTSGNDIILGSAGNDTIDGRGGNDLICGGGGSDIIDGGPDDDRIRGGDGNDHISGGSGFDLLEGENGNDQLFGGLGDDLLYGGVGTDQLFGGTGDDELFGGPDNDQLFGEAGSDLIDGDAGADVQDGGIGLGDTCVSDVNADDSRQCETHTFTPVRSVLAVLLEIGMSFRIVFGRLGAAVLNPVDAVVAPGERLTYNVEWSVPGPQNWHSLSTLDLHICGPTGVTIRWDEASDTFRLIDTATGASSPAGRPGSASTLETSFATLYLADTRTLGSGPTGSSVTLVLSPSFKTGAGRTCVVDVGSSIDTGDREVLTGIGTLRIVAGSPRTDGSDEDTRRRLTEEQRQHQQLTNRSNRADVSTEGNVVGVRCAASDPVPVPPRGFIVMPDAVPYALISTIDDGVQQILLIGETGPICQAIQLGDYLEADGVKQSEELFEADSVTLERAGRSVR